jgi:hypothetical protein
MMWSQALALVAVAVPFSAASSATVVESAGVECVDPNSANDLTRAVDAAMMELLGTQGWFHDLRTSSGYMNALSVFSCTPSSERWEYPAAAEATGILARVLSTGKLRVAGVKWSGGAADYSTDPDNPTGFWPMYLQAVVDKMEEHYAVPIVLERVYYDTSVLLVDAVASGAEVDMSEPYYYLSGFHLNTPRIESLAFSCVTAGTASKFFTKAGSGITSTDQLYNAIVAGPNRAVGFIGQGNYDAVSALLPSSVTPTFVTANSDIEANVLSGALVAGYLSEGESSDPTLFETFETGIISPRVALFHKDEFVCSQLASPPPSPSSPSATEEACSSCREEELIIVLIVLAAALLASLLLLAFVVVKERKGSPLFMPLMQTKEVEAVSTTSNKA